MYCANRIFKRRCSKKHSKRIYRDYTIHALNDKAVAKNYILHKGVYKTNIFDAASFVKEYIDDYNINYDKKLCIQNAPRYFVESFIRHKKIRWSYSIWYKLVKLSIVRFTESGRQMPFMLATRLIL